MASCVNERPLVRLFIPDQILETFQTFMESPGARSFRVTFSGLNVISLQVYVQLIKHLFRYEGKGRWNSILLYKSDYSKIHIEKNHTHTHKTNQCVILCQSEYLSMLDDFFSLRACYSPKSLFFSSCKDNRNVYNTIIKLVQH